MIELHDRFDDWLVGGGRDDPPRDLALHASGCESCLRAAAAFDALQGVDIGAAPMPAMRTTAPRRIGPLMSIARTVASAAAALVVGTALVIGASSWLGSGPPADGTAGQLSPGEGELAGGPSTGPSASGSPAATRSPRPSPSPTPSVLATPAPVILPTVAPPIFAPAPTIVPVPLPTATPVPTSSPTVAPTTIPTPTTAPTPPASASASPSPSPSPTDSSRPPP